MGKTLESDFSNFLGERFLGRERGWGKVSYGIAEQIKVNKSGSRLIMFTQILRSCTKPNIMLKFASVRAVPKEFGVSKCSHKTPSSQVQNLCLAAESMCGVFSSLSL